VCCAIAGGASVQTPLSSSLAWSAVRRAQVRDPLLPRLPSSPLLCCSARASLHGAVLCYIAPPCCSGLDIASPWAGLAVLDHRSFTSRVHLTCRGRNRNSPLALLTQPAGQLLHVTPLPWWPSAFPGLASKPSGLDPPGRVATSPASEPQPAYCRREQVRPSLQCPHGRRSYHRRAYCIGRKRRNCNMWGPPCMQSCA
jgi:hypothetical protein